MIDLKLNESERLIVESNYDSGRHIGISIGKIKDGDYSTTTLDRILSKAQIGGLEFLIASVVSGMLDEVKE